MKAKIAELGVLDVWERLSQEAESQLVDVRTLAEWNFVGVPDLRPLGKVPIFVEWVTFLERVENPRFVEIVHAELSARGAGQATNVFYLCRSGGRSLKAACAMAKAGYRASINVAEGFEGALDTSGHRGAIAGWKVAGLPWVQN